MEKTSHDIGQHAENACCEYLLQKGLKLLTKNFRGSKGEIDIVMEENNTLVFVEVRFRKNNYFGGAAASVTPKKQKRIVATAEQYLQQETSIKNGRIDVVAMSKKPQNTTQSNYKEEYDFEWIKNAF
jgi:putative endonuclease